MTIKQFFQRLVLGTLMLCCVTAPGAAHKSVTLPRRLVTAVS